MATQLAAHLINLTLGLLMLTAAKNSGGALFLDHVDALPFHRAMSWIFVHLSLLHVTAYVCATAQDSEQSLASHLFMVWDSRLSLRFPASRSFYDWGAGNWKVAMGTYAMLAMAVPLVLSLPCVRRRAYSCFYLGHQLLLPGFVLLCLHATSDLYYSLPGLVLLTLDAALRLYARLRPLPVVGFSAGLPNGMLSIRVDTSLRPDLRGFEGGQYVRMCAPDVSTLEWHPLSLAAWEEGPTGGPALTLLMGSSNGDWKRRMAQCLREGAALRVVVEGPYGVLPFRDLALQRVVCLAGGTGITPCLGVARNFPGRVRILWSLRGPCAREQLGDVLFQSVPIQVYETGGGGAMMGAGLRPGHADTGCSGGDSVAINVVSLSGSDATGTSWHVKLRSPQDSQSCRQNFPIAGRIPFAKALEQELARTAALSHFSALQWRPWCNSPSGTLELPLHGMLTHSFIELGHALLMACSSGNT